VGEQLELFAGIATAPQADEAPEEPEEEAPRSLAGQADLFGDRWLRASAAYAALESFDLDAAAEALREAVRRYPADASLGARADRVRKLAASLRAARKQKRSLAAALLAMEREVPAFLVRYWHRRLAEALEAEGGSGAAVDGVPAGLHWLRAGDPVRAEESLRATLGREPADCRARGYLGDALFAQNRQSEARVAYRDALALSPAEVDLAGMADAGVAELPLLAEEEYELPGDPLEWAAAVGLVEGVFAPPRVGQDWVDDPVLDQLAPGICCYRWLAAERAARQHEERIACRRVIKKLSPRLLEELLERK